MKLRTLGIAALTAVLGMTIAALAGGTVITAPVSLPNNSISDSTLRDSNGLSVIGRSANTTGDPGDIIAGADNTVLRRSGTSIGFGSIPESAVTSLTTDLSSKASSSRTISTTTPLSGGGDLSADRTLSIATNSTTSAGVVPQAPNDVTKFWRGDGTWATAGGSTPNNNLLDGVDGTCNFTGSGGTVCGATLSGSVYTMTRDIFSSTINISNGVEVKEMGYGIFNTGAINTNTSGKITDNGADASGVTPGAARAGGGRYGPNAAGGAPGSAPGASSQAPGPWLTTLAATATPSIGNGINGGLCQGGSGGSGTNGDPSAGGGAITIVNVGNSHAVGDRELTDGLTRLGNNSLTSGSGGSGGGNSSSGGNRGAGGASGGFVLVETDSFTGTGKLEAKGGAGAAATGFCGGGGGGGGGIIKVRYRTNGGVTFDVSGGAFGAAGPSGGFHGGTGGACKVIKQNLSGDGT